VALSALGNNPHDSKKRQAVKPFRERAGLDVTVANTQSVAVLVMYLCKCQLKTEAKCISDMYVPHSSENVLSVSRMTEREMPVVFA
jgi:hypothetical protein